MMVLVGSEDTADELFNRARQLADNSNAELFAVCVEPGLAASRSARKQFNNNLTLALLSGAKVIHLMDSDVVAGISNLIKKYKVDQLIIGNFNPANLPLSGIAGLIMKKLNNFFVVQ